MKHCPACDFNFPDFHLVCDFDGTDLVSEPGPSSISASSHMRNILTSPFFLIVVLGIALLGSAILIGYFDSLSQSASAVEDRLTVKPINNAAPMAKSAAPSPLKPKPSP